MVSAILIADESSECVETYRKFLIGKGHKVVTATTLEGVALLLGRSPCSVALIGSTLVDDLDSPLLAGMKKHHQDCKFVLTIPSFNVEILLKALHGNVFHECLVSPIDLRLLDDIVSHLTCMNTAETLSTIY